MLTRLGPTPAERAAKAPTPREAGFLEAVEILYGEGSASERALAYAQAMGRLAAQFPDEEEIQALLCGRFAWYSPPYWQLVGR